MKFEIKETLAKLLATENLIVEHRQVSTASFNVDSRVLTLPMWKKASNRVYDLLVGHEVGHALYTPNVDWRKNKYSSVPSSFVNVVEDARIEKLMKRRYPGLSKTFYKGYQELHSQDFFCVEEEDLNEMALIDRFNLYFKIGAYHMITFKEEEMVFVKRGETVETWDEVLELSYDLHEFLKIREQEPQKVKLNTEKMQQGQGDQSDESQKIDIEPTEGDNGNATDAPSALSDDESDEEPSGENSTSGGNSGGSVNEFESTTDEAFVDNQQELISEHERESTYVQIPECIYLDRIVVDCYTVHSEINSFYSTEQFMTDSFESQTLLTNEMEYRKYKKNAVKSVNYLVKEFEMKKSAAAYSRSAISKTGSLDTSKLHNYKFSEDIFKKITTLPEGKNHGLVFILDWSGSMCNVMHDTIKQLLNLVWFCKKVNIPFEVYAFTYEHVDEDDFDGDKNLYEIQDPVIDELSLHKRFRLMNLLSYSRSSSQFDEDCLNVWRLGTFTKFYGSSMVPSNFGLSGTPLNEAIVTLHHLLPEFIKETGVDKVNTVFLTDGESNGIGATVRMSEKYYPNGELGRVYVRTGCQLRDPKLGRTYKNFNDYEWDQSVTGILLTNLKDNFPQVNFISYRILEGRDVTQFFNYYKGNYHEIDKKRWSKERCAVVNTAGFDIMYVLASTSLNQSDEFDVDDGATNAQIRAAFRKSLKSKSTNNKILSSFATMVA